MVMLGVDVNPKKRGMGGLRLDLVSHYRDYRLAVTEAEATRTLRDTRSMLSAAKAGKVISCEQVCVFYKVISAWMR